MTEPIYVGQTFRATASELVDAAGVTLTTPVVTITITDPDDDVTVGTVVPSGSTYYAEFEADRRGIHTIVARAVAGGGTWIDKTEVTIS